jgi:hypothetical protein
MPSDDKNKKGPIGYLRTKASTALESLGTISDRITQYLTAPSLFNAQLCDYITFDPKNLNPRINQTGLKTIHVDGTYINELKEACKEIERQLKNNIPQEWFNEKVVLPVAQRARELKEQINILKVRLELGDYKKILETVQVIQTLLKPEERWDPTGGNRGGGGGGGGGIGGDGADRPSNISQNEWMAITETTLRPFRRESQPPVKQAGKTTITSSEGKQSYLILKAQTPPTDLLKQVSKDLNTDLELFWADISQSKFLSISIQSNGQCDEKIYTKETLPSEFLNIFKDIRNSEKKKSYEHQMEM